MELKRLYKQVPRIRGVWKAGPSERLHRLSQTRAGAGAECWNPFRAPCGCEKRSRFSQAVHFDDVSRHLEHRVDFENGLRSAKELLGLLRRDAEEVLQHELLLASADNRMA